MEAKCNACLKVGPQLAILVSSLHQSKQDQPCNRAGGWERENRLRQLGQEEVEEEEVVSRDRYRSDGVKQEVLHSLTYGRLNQRNLSRWKISHVQSL
jgi:hypothetical protein